MSVPLNVAIKPRQSACRSYLRSRKIEEQQQILKYYFLHSLMCWASSISVVAEGGSKNRSPQEQKLWAISDWRNIGSKRVGQNPVAFILSITFHCLSTDMGTTQYSITKAPAFQPGKQNERGRWQSSFYGPLVSSQATHAWVWSYIDTENWTLSWSTAQFPVWPLGGIDVGKQLQSTLNSLWKLNYWYRKQFTEGWLKLESWT